MSSGAIPYLSITASWSYSFVSVMPRDVAMTFTIPSGSMSWKASRSPVTIVTGMPLLPRALGERRDDVVGLEAVEADVRVAERLDERLEVRPLLGAAGPGRVLRWALYSA